MLESLEGKRGVGGAGQAAASALEGLFGKPTVVNKVPAWRQTASWPTVLRLRRARHRPKPWHPGGPTRGQHRSRRHRRDGIGITLGELVEDLGGRTESVARCAHQVGGPLGSYLPSDRFDLPMDYEAFAAADALLGHGGIVVFDETVDMAAQARFAMEFCAIESCGKCTPCRIGSTRGMELIDRIVSGDRRDSNLAVLVDLCEVMADGSLCAMGGLTPLPVRSALTHFTDDFHHPVGATV